METNRDQIEAGYAEWAERLVAEGWTPYLLTFMFRELGGSEASVARQMEREVERVYALHVTRHDRKPTAPSRAGRLPIWLCSPDRPVFKHKKQGRWDVTVNDGHHIHAAVFVPPWSRLEEDLVTHFDAHRDLYIRRLTPLIRIDVVLITHRIGYVIGYARKQIGRGLISQDATLILPRTLDEITSRIA